MINIRIYGSGGGIASQAFPHPLIIILITFRISPTACFCNILYFQIIIINIYNIFLQNAPKSHKKSGVPNFAIEGKNKKFYLGIGGTAKATLSYDWGDPIDNGFNFTTSSIPMNP